MTPPPDLPARGALRRARARPSLDVVAAELGDDARAELEALAASVAAAVADGDGALTWTQALTTTVDADGAHHLTGWVDVELPAGGPPEACAWALTVEADTVGGAEAAGLRADGSLPPTMALLCDGVAVRRDDPTLLHVDHDATVHHVVDTIAGEVVVAEVAAVGELPAPEQYARLWTAAGPGRAYDVCGAWSAARVSAAVAAWVAWATGAAPASVAYDHEAVTEASALWAECDAEAGDEPGGEPAAPDGDAATIQGCAECPGAADVVVGLADGPAPLCADCAAVLGVECGQG